MNLYNYPMFFLAVIRSRFSKFGNKWTPCNSNTWTIVRTWPRGSLTPFTHIRLTLFEFVVRLVTPFCLFVKGCTFVQVPFYHGSVLKTQTIDLGWSRRSRNGLDYSGQSLLVKTSPIPIPDTKMVCGGTLSYGSSLATLDDDHSTSADLPQQQQNSLRIKCVQRKKSSSNPTCD